MMPAQYYTMVCRLSSGLVEEVYLVRFENVIFGGGGVQYQQTSNASSTAGWFDFIGVTQESSATPLLDIQSAPNVTGPLAVFPGVQNVVVSHYMSADWLTPHFGAKKSGVVAINCSAPLCQLDGVTIASAGFPPSIPAVRVYAGRVTGTTILAGADKVWSVGGVEDASGLPIGTFKITDGAGWRLSGPAMQGNGEPTSALTFSVSGESKPRKIVTVDGSVSYARPNAPDDEPRTVVERHLSSTAPWEAVRLEANAAARMIVALAGCKPGDVVMAAHSGLSPRLPEPVQLTAIAGDGEAEAIMVNVGRSSVEVPSGQLRVVVMQLQ